MSKIKELEEVICGVIEYLDSSNAERDVLVDQIKYVGAKVRDHMKSVNKFITEHEERLILIEQHLRSEMPAPIKLQTEN